MRPADSDLPAARPPAEVPPDFLDRLIEDGRSLHELHGQIDGIVLAVPDAWSDGSVAGALAQEVLRRVLLERLELPLRWFVPQSAAAAAALASSRAEPTTAEVALVCDVGAHTVTATLCLLEGGTGRVLDVETSRAPVSGRAGAAFDARAVHAARERPHGEVAPEHPAAEAELLAALQAAKHHQRRRAALILQRAKGVRRYRDAPVYLLHGRGVRYALTADEAMRCFAPVADAIRETVGSLLGRRPRERDELAVVAVVGGFGAFPLVQETVLDTLPEAITARIPAAMLLGADAVARGALLLAEGSAGMPEAARRSVTLPVYRIRRGRLEAGRVPLTRAGEPAPMLLERDAGPLAIEVLPSHDLTLPVDVREDGRGPERPLALPPVALPAGHYHVGFWPARRGFGVIVFRPVGGGDPFVCPLVETGPTGTDRREGGDSDG
jgi:molecular chaperone DnaK (HSP70)